MARCVVLAQVVRVRRRGFGRGVEVVVWPGVLYWVVMSVNVVCCTRAARRLCVCRGPEVTGGHRVWHERFGVLVGGNGGCAQGGRRGHVCCGGKKRSRTLGVGRVRRRGVCA